MLQVGIITIEDLLEEILQQEIYDEKDFNPDSSKKIKKHHHAAGGGAMSGVCVCVCVCVCCVLCVCVLLIPDEAATNTLRCCY